MSAYTSADYKLYSDSLQSAINQIGYTSTSGSGIQDDINAKNSELTEKQMRQAEQLKEIQEKNKLIITRSRMLQLSQEKNTYKKKIIYSLIAIIILILVITLSTYVYFKKQKGSA